MAHHDFAPHRYHSTFGPHEPVLAVDDGDSVRTTTVDSSGFDGSNTSVTAAGNPLTGPFFVAGAEPGDTLEVRLLEIIPNRSAGHSSRSLSPQVVEPTTLACLPPRTRDRSDRAAWNLDLDRLTCSIRTGGSGSREVVVPLRPMMGCIGVAPAGGEALATRTAGRHGGNMDYNRLVSGSVLYFPVFVSGGLLQLGDGHAAQAEAEPAGTGIEVSMNVLFSVHVHRGVACNWPRGEDSDEVFTIGSARPLEHALQHATTEMIALLTEGFGMDRDTALLIIGQAARYDVANAHNPAYTVACRVRKSLLANSI